MTAPDAMLQLARAFPAALAPRVDAVAGRLALDQPRIPPHCFAVRLHGEELFIPERLYCEPEALLAATRTEGIEGAIALCLGTRDHDGFVREHCVRRLLGERHDWVVPFDVPFVVRLVGEYVAQIVAAIEAALPDLDTAAYGRFLRDNPRFLDTTERRVISYWYAYQHVGYRERGAEPGSRVIAAFRRMAEGVA